MDTDEHGRIVIDETFDEAGVLVGFLENQRATFAWKTGGLDARGLRATLPPSEMTLGGLVKHLCYVEDQWFGRVLHDRDPAPPWDIVDWKADVDWDWHSAASDPPEALYALWHEQVERSRADVARALRERGLGALALRRDAGGEAPTLRWILCHMIEEYARHVGHADLIRESVDGLVGE